MSNGRYEMNAVEKGISLVSPGAAKRRFENRVALTEFEARAREGLRGSNGGAAMNAAPETIRTNRDRINLMWEARSLERDSPLIAGVLKRLTQYVVGRVTYQPDLGDPVVNAQYAEYFNRWAKTADHTGRMNLREMVGILFHSYLRDGDHGFRIHPSQDQSKIKLQCIEADRIGDPHRLQVEKGKVAGVIIEKSRPIAYEVFRRDENGQYHPEGTVPATQFIHFYRNRRADEYRGRTPLEPALPSARDLLEIFGFEKQKSKFASQWAAFVTSADPQSNAGPIPWDKVDSKTGWNTTEAMPGKIIRTKRGEDVQMAPPITSPNQAFLNLVDLTVKMIALALDLPYGFVFDMARLGGVSARLEMQLAHRTIQGMQTALVDDVLDRIRDEVFRRAIAFGILPAHPNWQRGKWHFGAHITADVQYQTNADLQLIQAGLKSKTEWCEENDVDFKQTQERLADEINTRVRIAEERQLPLELVFGDMPQGTEMLAAFRAKDEMPEDKGLVEEVGESGVKPMIEVLELYHEGGLDRDTAIQHLVELYGFTHEKAALFVPEKLAIEQSDDPVPTNGRVVDTGRRKLPVR